MLEAMSRRAWARTYNQVRVSSANERIRLLEQYLLDLCHIPLGHCDVVMQLLRVSWADASSKRLDAFALARAISPRKYTGAQCCRVLWRKAARNGISQCSNTRSQSASVVSPTSTPSYKTLISTNGK